VADKLLHTAASSVLATIFGVRFVTNVADEVELGPVEGSVSGDCIVTIGLKGSVLSWCIGAGRLTGRSSLPPRGVYGRDYEKDFLARANPAAWRDPPEATEGRA
jgi:hypothetical protein